MKLMIALLVVFITMIVVGSNAAAEKPMTPNAAFVTYILWDSQEYAASMLVNSIRKWGGEYSNCPIYVVLVDPDVSGFHIKAENVEFVSHLLSDTIRYYPFASKAFAAAKVEEITAGKVSTLIWLDPETMILNPPREYDLKEGFAAAVAPVTFINTGQTPDQPVDAYWGPIYKRCDLDPARAFTVESFVDCKKIRCWLNCGMFSVRPERGLMREWAKILKEFIDNEEYQRSAMTDPIHRTFLHQAVISTLIASRLQRREIHMLPKGYNYPLFSHDLDFTVQTGETYRIPKHKRVKKLGDLVSVFSESLFEEHSDWPKYIPPADEPKKTWLTEAFIDRLKVVDNIYREEKSCNSYLITTSTGNVLIDPGGARDPESWLRRVSQAAPLRAILLTHGHEDHYGGIESWKGDRDIPVIGQRELEEFLAYNDRLSAFSTHRLSAQTGAPMPGQEILQAKTPLLTTELYDKTYSYECGGMHFEFFHTGGETPDQSVIWIRELKAVFIADNFYTSFPNIYTLRGTKPRWALDYIKALDQALALEPEVLLPGHGYPLVGKEYIQRNVRKYRDAIQYVHDATVKGMNEGKDVYTLMQEIKLPPELRLPQFFGRVSWSVRGIFDGYAGWFDENPSSMYALPPSSISTELLKVCGGSEVVVKRAQELAISGDEVRALHMTDVVLAAEPSSKAAWEVRLAALKSLLSKSRNSIETNWLKYGIRTAEEKIKGE
jgi:glyoxylase-like metal-dependent hydrolase (beta-lactamase superfamily II)